MNRLLPIALVCLSLLAICACRPDGDPPITGQRGPRPPVHPTPPPYVLPPDSNPAPTPTPPIAAQTPPPAPKPTPGDYPYGIPVSGKPGLVTSPYSSPDGGYIDVRGFAPGQEVRDPYTNKIFLVP